MLTAQDIKKKVGEQAAQFIRQGMTAGIGTGSTAYWLIMALGEKVKAGLDIRCVPTSTHTARLAREQGIPLAELNDVDSIDITIDGADEIDPQGNLIKGGGGALLQEKMVAAASRELVIIADHTKLVDHLGAFPLPVEVITFGWKQVQRFIEQRYGVSSQLRLKDGQPLLTDHGHYILDAHFNQIIDPAALNTALNTLPGVVDNGLFIGMATQFVIGYPDGTVKTLPASRPSTAE
ncbi:ribose-5-phosphate isomerase RpiA [Paraflavitalea sp. CAU 1676]|uniref:ribose-5-phosphate isomerase RpiA n=1 Tax=Paraflavitalea sp. CAU 1676 TaxID=3032598 RepID=UPI0023DAFE63|nr:ribose-5-phosphate isomerase RpiA [Paraflavitalea sp. CAU 1676]MDF2193681.1 ribose-5-phosphate isomerase RpiA [Paraflavitalea sp. CAU 1676]